MKKVNYYPHLFHVLKLNVVYLRIWRHMWMTIKFISHSRYIFLSKRISYESCQKISYPIKKIWDKSCLNCIYNWQIHTSIHDFLWLQNCVFPITNLFFNSRNCFSIMLTNLHEIIFKILEHFFSNSLFLLFS